MLEVELKKMRARFRKILNEAEYKELIEKVKEKGWERVEVKFQKEYVAVIKCPN